VTTGQRHGCLETHTFTSEQTSANSQRSPNPGKRSSVVATQPRQARRQGPGDVPASLEIYLTEDEVVDSHGLVDSSARLSLPRMPCRITGPHALWLSASGAKRDAS
jgi:hypothetical protein